MFPVTTGAQRQNNPVWNRALTATAACCLNSSVLGKTPLCSHSHSSLNVTQGFLQLYEVTLLNL